MEREQRPVERQKTIKDIMKDFENGAISLDEVLSNFRLREWPPLIDRTEETMGQMYRRSEFAPDDNGTFWVDEARFTDYETYNALHEAINDSRLRRQQEGALYSVQELMNWLRMGQVTLPQVIKEIKKQPRVQYERIYHYDAVEPADKDDISWIETAYILDVITFEELEQLYHTLEESRNL